MRRRSVRLFRFGKLDLVWLALLIGAFALYEWAGTGAGPLLVVLVGGAIVEVYRRASRPPEPGEFR